MGVFVLGLPIKVGVPVNVGVGTVAVALGIALGVNVSVGTGVAVMPELNTEQDVNKKPQIKIGKIFIHGLGVRVGRGVSRGQPFSGS